MTSDKLLPIAQEALKNAYAPYSHYKVGAALLCSDGTIETGCNVENASYGLTCCAERNAIYSAIAKGKHEFQAILVLSSGPEPPYPCGACRQVLSEFCSDETPIYVAVLNETEPIRPISLGKLLPHSFNINPNTKNA